KSSATVTYNVTFFTPFATLSLPTRRSSDLNTSLPQLTYLQGLKYKTVADANGSGNLTWTILDDGGTTNGGVNTLTETLSITVSAVKKATRLKSSHVAALCAVDCCAKKTAVS